MSDASQDPLEFLKAMWGKLGFPLPGVVTPTVDMDELDKRVADLKAVEGWLKMNLGMLQATIQGLEMQRATLAAWKSVGQTAAQAPANPFAQPGLWPWNLASRPAEGGAKPAGESSTKPARPGRRKKPEAG